MPKQKPDNDMDDYKAQDDARVLTSAAEIQGDPDRHQRAASHLEKQAGHMAAAHKTARKHLEKTVKRGMKKAFPADNGQGNDHDADDAPVKKKGKNFQQTKDAEMED
jgi:hypothetical protein